MFVQFDTGSNDLVVSSAQACKDSKQACEIFGEFKTAKSRTFKPLLKKPIVWEYGIGAVIALLSQDTFELGGILIKQQDFYVATKWIDSEGFGIMGVSLDAGQVLARSTGASYPSVISNLYKQGLIQRRAGSGDRLCPLWGHRHFNIYRRTCQYSHEPERHRCLRSICN